MSSTRHVNTPSLTTRHVVLEVLSAWPSRGAVPVRALVQVGELFDMADNSVRVALTRLVADGRVESPERGRYRLGPAAAAIEAKVSSWRRLDRWLDQRTWSGGWWMHTATGAARHRSRALRMWGFRELLPGTSVRPSNLVLDRSTLIERLRALGVGSDDLLVHTDSLGEREDQARGLWAPDQLEEGYARLTARLHNSMARLEHMGPADALREAFLTGREGIRALVLDPLLPAPLVDVRKRRELQDTLRAYDVRGQTLWRRFLGELLADEGEAA
ncbi:MAG: PaaX family transcriptional regulator [Myxococcota bacterium]